MNEDTQQGPQSGQQHEQRPRTRNQDIRGPKLVSSSVDNLKAAVSTKHALNQTQKIEGLKSLMQNNPPLSSSQNATQPGTKKSNASSLNTTALYSKGQLNLTQVSKKASNQNSLPVFSQAQVSAGQGSLSSKTFLHNPSKFTKVSAQHASESLLKEFDSNPGKTNLIPLKERAKETPARQRAGDEGELRQSNSEHETRVPVTQGTPAALQ